MNNITITHIDTACVLLEINGYRILTDPTLDRAGRLYYHGYGSVSRKTDNPGLQMADLQNIDLILLSHHQHKDNFDDNGKAFTKTVTNVISTVSASKAMPGITGLNNWQTHCIVTDKVKNLRITATPAQHHPWWIPEFISGEVIGFIIEFDGQEDGVIYITGDTVYFEGINQVARRYKIDIGIFHVGAVQFRYLTGLGEYTMNGKGLLQAVEVLDPKKVIPVHTRGWTHFKEKESDLHTLLSMNQLTKYRTIFLISGVPTKI